MVDWLSGWYYRKSHALNNASGAGTNYQMKIVVHYGSGSDNDKDVYLDGKCRKDFRDVRFTDDDTTTELDFWMESKVDSDNAVFWVEIADDLDLKQSIYIYYGKDDANYKSNGEDTFIFFDNFDGGLTLIDEPTNPVMTATETWEGNALAETSLIMDGDKCDCWYRGKDVYATMQMGYASAVDSKCAVWTKYANNPLTDIPSGSAHAYTLLHNGVYYMFVKDKSTGGDENIYLYQSTNKLNWSVMNGGNPILTHSSTPTDWYYEIFNVGVAIIGNTWHMLIEGKASGGQFKMGYSHSTLALLNWNTNISSNIVIDDAGNADLIYIPDKDRLLSLHGDISGANWKIIAHYANPSDNLSLAASWHSCPNFEIAEAGIHIADPHLCVTNFTKDYNIIISYGYNQVDIYQKYSELSLNDFYDAIITDPLAKWEGDTNSAIVSDGILTFGHDSIIKSMNTKTNLSDPCVLRTKRKMTIPAAYWIHYGLGQTDTLNVITNLFQTSGAWHRIGDADSFDTVISDWTSNVYKIIEIKWKSDKINFLEEESERTGSPYTTTANIPTVDIPILLKTNSNYVYVDWNLIRKYVDPEPTHGDWGEEEGSIPTQKSKGRIGLPISQHLLTEEGINSTINDEKKIIYLPVKHKMLVGGGSGDGTEFSNAFSSNSDVIDNARYIFVCRASCSGLNGVQLVQLGTGSGGSFVMKQEKRMFFSDIATMIVQSFDEPVWGGGIHGDESLYLSDMDTIKFSQSVHLYWCKAVPLIPIVVGGGFDEMDTVDDEGDTELGLVDYTVSALGKGVGSCCVYDTYPSPDRRVYGKDYYFEGNEAKMENGFINVSWNGGTRTLQFYYLDFYSWNYFAKIVMDKNYAYKFFFRENNEEVTELVIQRLDEVGKEFVIRMKRGSPLVRLKGTADWNSTNEIEKAVSNWKIIEKGDEVLDCVESTGWHNFNLTTVSNNYFSILCKYLQSGSTRRQQIMVIGRTKITNSCKWNIVHDSDKYIDRVKNILDDVVYLGILPNLYVYHNWLECETMTLSGGATSVADGDASGGYKAQLDAQNELCRLDMTYCHEAYLPKGKYRLFIRAKDSNQITDDLKMLIWNVTDASTIASTLKTLTNSYGWQYLDFEINEDDEDDTVRIEFKKEGASANTISADEYFIIPFDHSDDSLSHQDFIDGKWGIAKSYLKQVTQKISHARRD